jgi:subtilase family serine protease
LVAAAGDSGATDYCVNHDGVDYPASDPDVVTAGGKTLSLSAAHSTILNRTDRWSAWVQQQ